MTIISATQNKEKKWIKEFLDYSKSKNEFYENVFVKEENLVIKIPLQSNNGNERSNILIESFDLTKNVYLINIS